MILRKKLAVLGLAIVLAGQGVVSANVSPTAFLVLYETGFEGFEGFSPDEDLVGQGGWVGEAYDLDKKDAPFGGNGVLAGPLDGFTGQFAYIGFAAAPATADFNIWKPVNLVPTTPPLPFLRFRVSLQIVDSTTAAPQYDDFRWSIYNADGHRLFSVDFDNEVRAVNYILDEDDPEIRGTGFTFDNGVPYDLEIDMNFQRNLWTARVNGVVIVQSQPITSSQAKLTFGDADAVWVIRQPGKPGDNYMVFDDYRITLEPLTDIPPTLEPIGFLTNGTFLVRVLGEPGVRYRLEATTDFDSWVPVDSGLAQSPGGFIDLKDVNAGQFGRRTYRAVSLTGNP